MSPGLPKNDARTVALSDTVFFRQGDGVSVPGVIPPANLTDLLFSENSMGMTSPTPSPFGWNMIPTWQLPLADGISHVVQVGAEVQMRGVDAVFLIAVGARAVVKNEEPVRDGSVVQYPRLPVGLVRVLPPMADSIAIGIQAASPEPATICLLDVLPELDLEGPTLVSDVASLAAEAAGILRKLAGRDLEGLAAHFTNPRNSGRIGWHWNAPFVLVSRRRGSTPAAYKFTNPGTETYQ